MTTLFAFDLNPLHLIIIGALMFLVFGKRLPDAMRGLGQGIKEFKEGMNSTDPVGQQQITHASPPAPAQTDVPSNTVNTTVPKSV